MEKQVIEKKVIENNLIEKFKSLPIELIALIISYDNKLVYRDGIFISRFSKFDYRYDLLSKIPKPIYICKIGVLIRLMNCNRFGYFLKYNFYKDYLILGVRSFYRDVDGFDSYYDIITNNTYIFDKNSKWSKIINYTM